MKIEDDVLLATYRVPGACEVCGVLCETLCAHHVFARGSGRVDLPFNLISIGLNPFVCPCHARIHDGKIGLSRVLEIVAKREGVRAEWIEEEIALLRRLPQPRVDEQYEQAIADHYTRLNQESAKIMDPDDPANKPPSLVMVIHGVPYVTERSGQGWKLTKTQSGEPVTSYEVQPSAHGIICECQDQAYRKRQCKHAKAVEFYGLIGGRS
jgi:hypothetical protein